MHFVELFFYLFRNSLGKKHRMHAVHVFLSEDSTYLLFFCLKNLLETIIFPFVVNCCNQSWDILLKYHRWSSISFTDHWVLSLSTLHNECLIGILLKHHLVTNPEEIPSLTRSDSLKSQQYTHENKRKRKYKVMRVSVGGTFSMKQSGQVWNEELLIMFTEMIDWLVTLNLPSSPSLVLKQARYSSWL